MKCMKQSPILDDEKCDLNNNKRSDRQGLDNRWNKMGLSSQSAMTAQIHVRDRHQAKKASKLSSHVKRWVGWLLYPPPHVSMDNI